MIRVYRSQIGSHGSLRETISPRTFLFPAGELGLQFDASNYKFFALESQYQTIVARIKSSDDLMELVMAVDALRNLDDGKNIPIRLVLPWLPYARQDRICSKGESHSLKAFARLINSLNFMSVTIFDPHSDVAGAVIDNAKIISQLDIISRFDSFNARIVKNENRQIKFISPDAGGNKKTFELASYYGHDSFLRADKIRDLATGKIKEIVVINPREDVEGRDVIVCDDIGDGMGTFVGLASSLKAKGANKVILYITHAILSKGIDMVFAGGVDELYTTNSYRTDLVPTENKLNVLRLGDIFFYE